MKAKWPDLSPGEFQAYLTQSAVDIGDSQRRQGHGQVNAGAAVATTPNRESGTDENASKSDQIRKSATIEQSLNSSSDADEYSWTFAYEDPIQIEIELSGPSKADFDLYAFSADRGQYSSTSSDSQETVSIKNPSTWRRLRVVIISNAGEGMYELTITEYQ